MFKNIIIIILISALSLSTFYMDGDSKTPIKNQAKQEAPLDLYICNEDGKKCRSAVDIALDTLHHKDKKYVNTYHWTRSQRKKQTYCLAQNIYWEARGEPRKGQIKVGLSTLHRVKDKRFPNTICKVVFDKRWHKKMKRYVHQMSWTYDKSKHNKTVPKRYIRLAQKIIAGRYKDRCMTTNWFNPLKSVKNSFNERMIMTNKTLCTQTIDNHIFLAYK